MGNSGNEQKVFAVREKMQDLENLTIQCMKCGVCQAECPLYQNNFRETSVARGKISLIELIVHGKISQAEEVYSVLDYCVHCGKCKETCSSGVLTDLIFFQAKNVLRDIHSMSLKEKSLLNLVMEKPESLASLSPVLYAGGSINNALSQTPILKSIKSHLPGSVFKRNVKTPARKNFTKTHKGWHLANNEIMKVVFYPGCAINFLYDQWGKDIITVLNRWGISVYIPQSGRCCGIPAATMGNLDLYKKNFHKNADELEAVDVEYVITACPTCNYGIGELGESITGRKTKYRAVDILAFLNDILGYHGIIRLDEKTTLHTPCHYDKKNKTSLENIINSYIDSTFIPMEKTGCCGFGGTFNLKNYDVSLSIAKKKISELEEKKISVLFAPCPGCAMQLADAAKDTSINVVHPINIIREGI